MKWPNAVFSASVFDEHLGRDAGRLEPPAVEALGKILLVIGVQFASQMQADFIDEPGQINPARHHFARTARVNNFCHNRILPQTAAPVNATVYSAVS